VSLFSWEGRVSVNGSIKVTGENVFDLTSGNDMFRANIGKLDPIV
jgi:hypothetical protein